MANWKGVCEMSSFLQSNNTFLFSFCVVATIICCDIFSLINHTATTRFLFSFFGKEEGVRDSQTKAIMQMFSTTSSSSADLAKNCFTTHFAVIVKIHEFLCWPLSPMQILIFCKKKERKEKRKECSKHYCIFAQQQKWLVIIWWWPPRTACIVFFYNVSRWLRPGTFFDILHAHVLRLLQQHGVLLLQVRRPQSSPQRTLLHKKRGLKTFRLAKSADVVWLQACRANFRLFCSVCGVALLLLKLHAY